MYTFYCSEVGNSDMEFLSILCSWTTGSFGPLLKMGLLLASPSTSNMVTGWLYLGAEKNEHTLVKSL